MTIANRIVLGLLCILVMAESVAQENNYAESVAIAGISADGLTEVSIRLARFPQKGEGHIWVHLAVNNEIYSVVDESVALTNRNPTDVSTEQATFTGLGDNYAQFVSRQRQGENMNADVEARTMMFADHKPGIGAGTIPIHLDLKFEADNEGVKLNQSRWEVTGTVSGKIRLHGKDITLSLPGKWHEQTGQRRQFAPPFTYFNVQSKNAALLAIHYPTLQRTAGYLREKGGNLTQVTSLQIGPVSKAERTFELQLADGRSVTGTTRVTRHWSVPIEGTPRPGSTVVVQSSLGNMVGALNDWNPAGSD